MLLALKADGDKVITTIILTKEQKKQLEEHSQRLGIGVSALIRLAVAEWLESKK